MNYDYAIYSSSTLNTKTKSGTNINTTTTTTTSTHPLSIFKLFNKTSTKTTTITPLNPSIIIESPTSSPPLNDNEKNIYLANKANNTTTSTTQYINANMNKLKANRDHNSINNRFIDSILKLFITPTITPLNQITTTTKTRTQSSTTLNAFTTLPRTYHSHNNPSYPYHHHTLNNKKKKLPFNKLFSRSTIKTNNNNTTNSNSNNNNCVNNNSVNRKTINYCNSRATTTTTTTSSNSSSSGIYSSNIYSICNQNCDYSDVYMNTSLNSKSMYSTVTSKELSWYKMQELDPYYQILGII